MDGYFVAPDAYDDLCVWRKNGDRPVAIVNQRQFGDGPDLWDAIVKLIEGES